MLFRSGQDFNPRNWRVTRAQCQTLAGGVVGSQTTRSFLDVTPSHAETGWMLILPKPLDAWSGKRIGVHTGISGLDRLALSRLLRARTATPAVRRVVRMTGPFRIPGAGSRRGR